MLLDAFFFIKFPMILLVDLVLGQKLEYIIRAGSACGQDEPNPVF